MKKNFRCSVVFYGSWIMTKKVENIKPVDSILAELRKRYAIVDVESFPTDCDFTIFTDEDMTDKDLSKEIKDLIGDMFEDAFKEGNCKVTVKQKKSVNSESAQPQPDQKQEVQDSSADEHPGKTDDQGTAQTAAPQEQPHESPYSARDKGNAGRSKKTENVIEKIDALVGAEQFKELAHECIKIAPHLKKSETVDAFIHRKYLVSVNDGYGMTEYLTLFSQLVSELDLFRTDSSNPIEEIKLPSPASNKDFGDIFGQAIQAIHVKGKKKVICIDISEWMSKTTDMRFRAFLKEVDAASGEGILFFRVPFVEAHVLDELKVNLNDYLFIKELSIIPFTMDQLCVCAESLLRKKGFSLDENAMKIFVSRIVEEKSDGKFYGINTVSKVVNEMLYLKEYFNAENSLDDKDIIGSQIKQLSLFADQPMVSSLDVLNDMAGMQEVKQKLIEIISQIETAINDGGIESPCIHMRFVGNPGTGKTTVARILGQILREKGILRNGNFFEYGGRDFCGQYIGETAPKTAAMCRDAYGSVLFIDEAYSLYREDAGGKDYGREAIDTLIAEMENHRTDLMVIMAGYPDEMEHLMKANPGLRSRMPYQIEFRNFTREELAEIFFKMAGKHFELSDEFKAAVKNYFLAIPEDVVRAKEFSNGRFVRNLYERTWGKAALRKQMNGSKSLTLEVEDFNLATTEKEFQSLTESKTKRIGFN